MVIPLQHLDCPMSGHCGQLQHIGELVRHACCRAMTQVMKVKVVDASARACAPKCCMHRCCLDGEYPSIAGLSGFEGYQYLGCFAGEGDGSAFTILGDLQERYPLVQVHMPPLQRQQFPPAHGGFEGEHYQGLHQRIPPTRWRKRMKQLCLFFMREQAAATVGSAWFADQSAGIFRRGPPLPAGMVDDAGEQGEIPDYGAGANRGEPLVPEGRDLADCEGFKRERGKPCPLQGSQSDGLVLGAAFCRGDLQKIPVHQLPERDAISITHPMVGTSIHRQFHFPGPARRVCATAEALDLLGVAFTRDACLPLACTLPNRCHALLRWTSVGQNPVLAPP